MYCVLCVLWILLILSYGDADRPCAARAVPGQSVVCVCNSSYCDEVVRFQPPAGSYLTYTTSKDGLRFETRRGVFKGKGLLTSIYFDVEFDRMYQRIEGFGGAVTDSTGINWKSLPDDLQDSLVKSYFSDVGSEYNMIRVPIGGSDFSTHPYAYNELPQNDTHLTNYTLAPEDYEYKIPMIKAAMSNATAPVHVVATTWSPPPWMKTSNEYGGKSQLKNEFYQTYADYHLKFLEEYETNGIEIWGITTTNEPINGKFNLTNINSLGWSVNDMGLWIVNNLGPTIRSSKFEDVNIIACDDQRYTIPFWFNGIIDEYPEALEYIDGVAVHYYADELVSPLLFEIVTRTHPEKFILATEACEGSFSWESPKVLLGSWQRAVHYIKDILEDLNHDVIGWIDWNMCLNMEGGPCWTENFVDSPIIVNADAMEFYKQPMYYALAHFSKFLPRGSVRVAASTSYNLSCDLQYIFFVTPRNTVVGVFYNGGSKQNISIKCAQHYANVELAAESVTTVEIAL